MTVAVIMAMTSYGHDYECDCACDCYCDYD